MSGLINFRDFGGYATRTGARVRTDILYRSGHLANLRPDDLSRILDLDFSLVADLRFVAEREGQPSPWPKSYSGRIFVYPGDRESDAPHVTLLKSGDVSPQTVRQFYAALYRGLAFDPLYRSLFAQILRRIADGDGRILIHCNAGKDRTGILAALLLHVLGVNHETVVADFMRSSNAPGLGDMVGPLRERIKTLFDRDLPDETVRALLDVHAEYIEGTLASLVDRCGSIEAYLTESGAGEEVQDRLRARLLSS